MHNCVDGLLMLPVLIPFRAQPAVHFRTCIALILTASLSSPVSCGSAAAQLHAQEQEGSLLPKATGSPSPSEACAESDVTAMFQPHRGFHTSFNSEPLLGNSFIAESAEVHKAPPPRSDDDVERTASSLPPSVSEALTAVAAAIPQSEAVSDGVGVHVANLASKTLGHVASESAAKGWWPGIALLVVASSLFLYLVVYVAFRAIVSWRRKVTLGIVQEKVHRTNETLLGMHGDRSLCLCCAEFVPGASPNTITFLCGHSFHMTCIKDWCKRHLNDGEEVDACPGRCPICTNPTEETSSAAAPVEIELSTYSDCARLFAFQNLSERYPDVFTKDDSQRMLTQSTAVLFADSQFAKCEPQSTLRSLFDWSISSCEKASA